MVNYWHIGIVEKLLKNCRYLLYLLKSWIAKIPELQPISSTFLPVTLRKCSVRYGSLFNHPQVVISYIAAGMSGIRSSFDSPA